MKKKIVAVLMATAMACTMAGCGGTDAPADGGAASGTESGTENKEKTTDTDTGSASEGNTDTGSAEEETPSVEVTQATNDAIQNLINATEGTVTLTVWASELQQEFTQSLIDKFKAEYPDVDFNITLGACSEAQAKDTVLTDIEAAADVYTFADDQINELVAAGALQEVAASYTYDVTGENMAGAVDAASIDGKLYAYPMTASNGYFMFYSKEFFDESQVGDLDTMMSVAAENGKKVSMEVSGGWYLYSFFKGAGYEVGLNDDGTNYCTWNAAGATDVAQGILDICANPGFQVATDAEFQTGIAEGTIIAGVSGTWDAEAAAAAWGDNYAAAKLPTYTVAGSQVQMSSFSGYKLIGVNPHSEYVGWSMLLAEYLTNEASQVARFEATSEGPANKVAASADAVKANPAISALAAQAEFATPQRVGGNYWSPSETLGTILAGGNAEGTDLQTLLDNAVEGITAPIE